MPETEKNKCSISLSRFAFILRRNKRLLEREMEADLDNLLLLTQYIESWGKNYENQLFSVRRGVGLVRAKQGNWKLRGANLLRYAVHAAHKQGLPGLRGLL